MSSAFVWGALASKSVSHHYGVGHSTVLETGSQEATPIMSECCVSSERDGLGVGKDKRVLVAHEASDLAWPDSNSM